MEVQLDFLPFDDWVAHVFDHEVREPEWYFDLEAPVWMAPAALTLAHVTRLFNDPLRYLSVYTDQQLNQGFWYLVSNAGSNHMFALTDASAPLRARIRCVESFVPLFAKLFAVRCSDHLSNLAPADPNSLNGACYMWWDIIPLHGAPDDPIRHELDAAALAVMEEILSLESIPCRESALHGLGHWHSCYPTRVGEIIGRAMSQGKGWSSELITYARNARTGCVL